MTVLFAVMCAAGPPVPTGTLRGHNIGSSDAPIQFEFVFDHLCPDSATVSPTLDALMSYYGPSRMNLIVHSFPLPYHRNAFLGAQANRVIYQLAGEATWWQFYKVMWTRQSDFWDLATLNLTQRDIWALYGTVAKSVGVDPNAFIPLMNYTDNTDYDARTEWKYSASRGVFGTPTFFVNGALVDADPDWTVADWRQVLDPLVAE